MFNFNFLPRRSRLTQRAYPAIPLRAKQCLWYPLRTAWGCTLSKVSSQAMAVSSTRKHVFMFPNAKIVYVRQYLAPVPLSIFRSNSKFDENSKHSSVTYTRPITTIFCTRHDSVTVVTCAKYRCDRLSIFETRAFWIFIEFRIRSKYA